MDHIMQWVAAYGPYAVLAVAAYFEGPVTAFIAGSQIAAGILDPYITCAILVAKDLVLDTWWYAVGRFARIPYFEARLARVREKSNAVDWLITRFERPWREHPVRMMWITKLAYGFSMYLLITAGLAKVPFKKFYLYTLPVTVFQFGGLMTLGYFLGGMMWNTVQNIWVYLTGIMLVSLGLWLIIPVLLKLVSRRYVERQ